MFMNRCGSSLGTQNLQAALNAFDQCWRVYNMDRIRSGRADRLFRRQVADG